MRLHHVIVIHGIGDHDPGYSNELQKLILDHLRTIETSTEGRTNYSERLCFHEVNWSDIRREEQQKLLKHDILPDEWLPFNLWHPLDSLVETVDRNSGISNQIRSFLITSLGDVFTYLTSQGKQHIQDRLKAEILLARDAQHNKGYPEPHYLSIIAHSLGSVVTYDLARYFGDTVQGKAEIGTARLANLFTFGSPLALFSLLEYGQQHATPQMTITQRDGRTTIIEPKGQADQKTAEELVAQSTEQRTILPPDGQATVITPNMHIMQRETHPPTAPLEGPSDVRMNTQMIDQIGVLHDGQSNQMRSHPYSGRGIRLDLAEGMWLNFYDQQDPLACKLERLYRDAEQYARVVDIPVQSGALRAHSDYWRSRPLAEQIAEQLQRTIDVLDAREATGAS